MPKVDLNVISSEEYLRKLANSEGNVNYDFLMKMEGQKVNFKDVKKDEAFACCHKGPNVPKVWDLKTLNVQWQSLKGQNESEIFLKHAFFDDRGAKSHLRILTLIDITEAHKRLELFCQIFHENEVSVSRVSFQLIWQKGYGTYDDGVLQPYLLSCPLGEILP